MIMKYLAILLTWIIMLAGCRPAHCGQQHDQVLVSAVVYPDGDYFALEDKTDLMSVSQFRNMIREMSLAGNIEVAGVYVRPCEWWDVRKHDFREALSPIAMLTNVQHMALIVGCSPQRLDLSVFRDLRIEELGFSGYEIYSPKCVGLEGLPLKKIALIDTCSIRGLAVSNRIDVCECLGVSPSDSELRPHFVRIKVAKSKDCSLFGYGGHGDVVSARITRIDYEGFGVTDRLPSQMTIDISGRRIKLRSLPAVDLVFTIDDSVMEELSVLLQDAGMMSWRGEYRYSGDLTDRYEAWRVALYSGERVIKEINGQGDVPEGILAFWRLWSWGVSRANGAAAVDPHATYRWVWQDYCFRPYSRADDAKVDAYLRKEVPRLLLLEGGR